MSETKVSSCDSIDLEDIVDSLMCSNLSIMQNLNRYQQELETIKLKLKHQNNSSYVEEESFSSRTIEHLKTQNIILPKSHKKPNEDSAIFGRPNFPDLSKLRIPQPTMKISKKVQNEIDLHLNQLSKISSVSHIGVDRSLSPTSQPFGA